jgi:hypothetical protein
LLIYDLFESGRYAEVAALGCVTISVITILTLAFRQLSQHFGLGAAAQ